jgi:hypothetical protein
MDVQKLLAAAELVGELAETFESFPEGGAIPGRAAAALAMGRLYMLRYARHLHEGREPYEALKACVEDERLLREMEKAQTELGFGPGGEEPL